MVWFAVVLGAVVLLLGALWLFQRSLIYFPDPSTPRPAGEVLSGARDVSLMTDDGLELGAWYRPAEPACTTTVLVAPGNGGNRSGRVELGREIAARGFGVLLLDYRGYGGNPGRPTEDGLALDARAGRRFLTVEAGVAPQSLVYFGESIGAAVVTELATEFPPRALVLRSPFTSLADVGRAAYGIPVGWFLEEEHPLAQNLARVQAPIAVVYGGSDTIVPPRQSRDVAQAARRAGNEVLEVEVPGANHNEPELAHGPPLLDALVAVSGAENCA